MILIGKLNTAVRTAAIPGTRKYKKWHQVRLERSLRIPGPKC